ncbi:hypothetical protein SLS60_001266 [Paraconiothyrium brasiliense]|uniref:Uncharacterized protein n=1 Tax=Paraconiothyrium brasiliense TaxID=300254 RepID=A0ABR3S9Q4_9PLEO
MPPLNLANSHDHQEELFHAGAQSLLVRMTALEDAMGDFGLYVSTQNTQNKPLKAWPKYDKYQSLAAASERLDDIVKRMEALIQRASFNKCYVNLYTAQARGISIKISNTIASSMKTMSEKTTDFDTKAEAGTRESIDQDADLTTIMAELAKLIKHLTAAADSTWAAMNVLESIPPEPSNEQGDKTTKKQSYLSWACWATVAALACIAVFNGHVMSGTRRAPQLPGLDDVIVDMQSVCGMVNKHLHVAAQVQNATLAEFNERFRMIEKALASNDERINNVCEGSIPHDQGSDIRNMKKWMGKLEADALEFKRNVQRAEVRMTTRINKLERKKGKGGGEMN